MKNLARLLTISALLTTGSYAAPFLAVGDGAEIFLTGTLGIREDSNIYLSATGKSDTIYNADPGLQLVFGKNSAVQGSWSVGESFTRYADHSALNSSLPSTNFNASFSDGKSNGSFNAGYSESEQNQVDDGTHLDFLIHRKSTNLGANGELSVTQKTSVSAGIQYAKTDYARAGFSDSDEVTLPFNYYYEVTPKVDLSLGYRYRQTSQQIGEDSKDHFFNVGARGEFTPKLTGSFNIGLTQRTLAHSSSQSLLGIDSNLNYAATPKTSVQFGVTNDFDTNSQGQQQKNFSIHASANSSLSEQWSLTTGLSYRAIDYYTRVDDYVEAQAGVSYVVNAYVRITGSFTYRTNKSDLPTSEFDGNVLSITASFRY